MWEAAPVIRTRRKFCKLTYRGVDLEQLLENSGKEMATLYCTQKRRAFNRTAKKKDENFLTKLSKAKMKRQSMERPKCVKTHRRNMVIEHEMIGHCSGELAMAYRPVKHGRPGISATNSSNSHLSNNFLCFLIYVLWILFSIF